MKECLLEKLFPTSDFRNILGTIRTENDAWNDLKNLDYEGLTDNERKILELLNRTDAIDKIFLYETKCLKKSLTSAEQNELYDKHTDRDFMNYERVICQRRINCKE